MGRNMNWLVSLLLLFQACLALTLIPESAATRNECAHIPAGLICWYADRFDLYRVNPPLPRMLATLPLLFEPDISLEFIGLADDNPATRQEFTISRFFADTNALNYHAIICRARLAGVVWLTLGGFLIWRWALELFGPSAGLMALVLWVAEPMINAHGMLATPDLPATVAGLAVGYTFWRLTRSGSLGDTVLCGTALGVALLTKYTHLLWLPLGLVLFALARADKTGPLYALGSRRQAACLGIIGVTAWLALWTGYSFTGFGSTLGHLTFVSHTFGGASDGTRIFDGSPLGKLPCPLPPAFLSGIDTQQRDFEGTQWCYLRGEWNSSGWWYFYVYGLTVKLTVGLLGLIALAAISWLLRPSGLRPMAWTMIWLPAAAVLVAASLKDGKTMHVRYVLPAVPFLIVAASRLAEPIQRFAARFTTSVAWVLVGLSVASVAMHYHNWLGYFNEFAGGPANGWWHLADSNVDWGQDLVRLKRWLDDNPEARPFRLAYHNYYDYRVYTREMFDPPAQGRPGYVAVDAMSLTRGQGQWLLGAEPIVRIGTSIFIYRIP